MATTGIGRMVLVRSYPGDGTTCYIEGCERKPRKRGMCDTHYARWLRTGNTEIRRAPNGTGVITYRGYKVIYVKGVRYYEHVFVAEKALGKKMPPGAVIHHVDGNGLNNDPTNLVICPDKKYHSLIHARMEALRNGNN